MAVFIGAISGVDNIKEGDLVKVKKYGWIMRVDKIDQYKKRKLYYLENDKRGFLKTGKTGNPGSYLKSEIALVK